MADDIKLLTSVGTTGEADMVIGQLHDVGIRAIVQRSVGGPEWGASGPRDVYVSARDIERARELLTSDENPVSDEELTRLSEDAGREAGGP